MAQKKEKPTTKISQLDYNREKGKMQWKKIANIYSTLAKTVLSI